MQFEKFNKIPRLSRDIIITEKIDGSNGQIYIISETEVVDHFILNDENFEKTPLDKADNFIAKYSLYMKFSKKINSNLLIFAGSRKRWLSLSEKNGDNMSFAKWVQDNAEELINLGEGRTYGEWYGNGIQRNYGLEEKRFALFNVKKWVNHDNPFELKDKQEYAPKCCGVVPILYKGEFNTIDIKAVLADLKMDGSSIVPGFMNPEGICIYHKASGQMFKKTIVDDEKPKGL